MILPLGWNPYSRIAPSNLLYLIMEWLSLWLQNGRIIFDGELYNLNPPLYRAAKLGLYDICKILIDYGADVNYTKDHIFYPLEGAASSNNIDIVKLLLDNNADINGYDLVKLSAIGTACTKGHYDMMAYLVECGADINRLNIGLYLSPLDLAIIWKRCV